MNAVAKRSLIVHEDAWLLALDARRCILGPIRADLGAAAISLTDCIVDGLGRALAVWHAELTHARACRGAEEPLRTGPARRGHHVRRPRRRRGRRRRRLPLRPRPLGAAHPGGLPAPLLRGPAGGLSTHPLRYRCLDDPAPTFVTDAFDAGGYLALDLSRPSPLLSAAGDGGEIGAYHHARRIVRLSRLRNRLHEYVPLGLRPALELAPWEEA